jgi:GNAT superfamily N-acetyltransferase
MIRLLDPLQDAGAVLDLQTRAADYIDLESGRAPSPELASEYFSDAPPNGSAADSLKLGLFQSDRLQGLIDLAFGYPEPTDAYLGLLLLAPEARGRGLGRVALAHVENAARARGATRLLLAVLETNSAGLRFWTREGFGSPKYYPAAEIGHRSHVRIRLEKPL